MMKKIILFTFLLFVILVPVNIEAWKTAEALIEGYKQALKSDNPKKIEKAWRELRASSTAVTDMKANHPRVYKQFKLGYKIYERKLITESPEDYRSIYDKIDWNVVSEYNDVKNIEDLLDRPLPPGEQIILSISGVNALELDAIKNILGYELKGSINYIKTNHYSKGIVEYMIFTDLSTDKFAKRVGRKNFSSFRLDVVKIAPFKIVSVIRGL